jgi:TfoX/Sxy family transcriptional regulator of competence genes
MSRSLELLNEACAPLKMSARKMFGGHGFFAPNGGMFAGIVTDDEIIFKLVVGPLRDELIGLGGKPWVYQGRDREMTMNEWIVVPENFYDDGDLMAQWAEKAHGAVPGKGLKPKKKASPKPKPAARRTASKRRASRASKKRGA